ncbi:MAG: hypothetical protein FWC23_00655 [Chitinispirillia bacterium]|nr:hypothetical protein [Chitinispirillia bacterium]MCL2267685.1 hypothetical protein [Chitinispirillia bacterium]
MRIAPLTAISALAAALALSGCGGSKTTSGGGALSSAESGTGTTTRVRESVRTAPAEEPDTSWYNSEGTVFQITKAGQLAGLAKLVNRGNRFEGKTIMLSADIDLSGYNSGAAFNDGKGWIPIGTKMQMFKGTFAGGGKTIRGLYINDPKLFQAGLFGRVDGGTIKELGLADVNITAGGRTGAVAGGIAGSTIEQCHSSGNIKGKGFVGGLVGNAGNKSNVLSSYSTAAVNGENYVGGLVGEADNGSTVARSYSTGNITGNEAVGGISGAVMDKDSNISNCYSTGKITCGSSGGGIAGQIADGASVTTSWTTSEIHGRTRVGGIAGQVGGAITGCVALNPSLKTEAKGAFAGRIGGHGDGRASSANLAFSGMKNAAGTTDWTSKGDKGKDGTDISAAQVSNDGTIGGRFTTQNGWTTMNGMLPGFGTAIRVPDHMR